MNLRRSSCLSVMWGVLMRYPSWGVFLLKRYLTLPAFLVMAETFPSLFVGEIEAVAPAGCPVFCSCVLLVEQQSLE